MPTTDVQTVTLTANTVATITLDAQFDRVEVQAHSDCTADVWVTFDGSTPSAKAEGSFFVAATPAVAARLDMDRSAVGDNVVKLLSTATGTVTVIGKPETI